MHDIYFMTISTPKEEKGRAARKKAKQEIQKYSSIKKQYQNTTSLFLIEAPVWGSSIAIIATKREDTSCTKSS